MLLKRLLSKSAAIRAFFSADLPYFSTSDIRSDVYKIADLFHEKANVKGFGGMNAKTSQPSR